MRVVAYNALRGAPAKVAFIVEVLVSVATTVWPGKVKEWANWAMTPEEIRLIGLAGLVIGLAYWLALLLLKPPPKPTEGSLTQATAGTQSHNINTGGGPVTINHHAPAPENPLKSPYGGWSNQNLEGLNRVMSGPARLRSALAQGLGIEPAKPDMSLNEVAVRLYKLRGPAPKDEPARSNFRKRIDFEIMDEAVENHWHVWGRYGERARELLHYDALAKGKLSHVAGTFSILGPDAVRPMVFKDLRFNREEVDQIWPKE